MKKILPRGPWRAGGIAGLALCLVLQLSLSGCEPLRKKFVRKKKAKTEDLGFVPVFAPEEYQGVVAGPEDLYRQQYALCFIWTKEVQTNLDDRYGDKKIQYSLNKLREQLGQLREMIAGASRERCDGVLQELDGIMSRFAGPELSGNKNYLLTRKVASLESRIRSELKPEQIQGDLVHP